MRIWDVHCGYLNRQSLLGEHRELHGMVSILVHGKKGYARHPETLRWANYTWALKIRHQQLAEEMGLRSYRDRSPVTTQQNRGAWPDGYIDEPHEQFNILAQKYEKKEQGRIPLPKTAQQLWSHHKYSILARDAVLYKTIGQQVAQATDEETFIQLSRLLSEQLRYPPSPGGIRNALQHMWGHVSRFNSEPKEEMENWSMATLLNKTQALSMKVHEPYLMVSTALSELGVWIKEK